MFSQTSWINHQMGRSTEGRSRRSREKESDMDGWEVEGVWGEGNVGDGKRGDEKKEVKRENGKRRRGAYLCITLQHSPACSDRLASPLCASDLLTHHFSLYSGLEGKSEGHTHDQLCVYACVCMCVYIEMTVWDVNVVSGLQSRSWVPLNW